MTRILIIQLAKFGDLLQSQALLRKITDNFYNSEITLLCSDIFHEVCSFFDSTINVIPVNLDTITTIVQQRFHLNNSTETKHLITYLNDCRFDMVVNLNTTALSFALLQHIASKEKYGYGATEINSYLWHSYMLSFVTSRQLNSINLVDFYRNLVQPQNCRIPQITKKNTQQRVAFQLSSRNEKRLYACNDFATIANQLINNNYTIVLTGNQNESSTGLEFLQQIHQPLAVENHIGKTSLAELAALLESVDFLLTGDTGTMHLACAVGTPVFALFLGPAYPFETLGWSPLSQVLFPDRTRCSCYPCPDQTPCPNHFICHQIPTESVIRRKAISPSLHCKSHFDAIGQILLPVEPIPMPEHFYWAWQFRNIAAQYFLHSKLDWNSITPHFHELQDTPSQDQSFLRELTLFQHLQTKLNQNDIDANFSILKPLLYLSRIAGDKAIPFVSFILDYFHLLTKE